MTISPVVKTSTVELLLALAVNNGCGLNQLDVSNAFLHGILKEEIYMAQPQGYVDPAYLDNASLLHEALYGLKRVPRAWFERFITQLLGLLGFIASGAHGDLFIYKQNTHLVYLLLYVDDIIVTGNHSSLTDFLHLTSKFWF